ncbi:MAG: hypothetical protein ABW152_04995 [Candidatus Thiodiazotropha endolucinida]
MKSTKTMTNPAEPSLGPTRLAAIGMDQRQRNALHMIFSSRCNKRYVLTEEASSEICILDLDSFGGDQKWKEFRERHPDWPLILVSINSLEISDRHTLFVQKPIPVERLIAAIETHRRNLVTVDTDSEPAIDDIHCNDIKPIPGEVRARRKAVSTRRAALLMSESQEQVFVGTSPDIDPEDPDHVDKIFYKPEHYLQGLAQQALNQAVRYNQNINIQGPWPEITLDIVSNKIWVSASDRQLRPYSTMPDTTLEVQLNPVKTDWTPPVDATEHSFQSFIWQLALWASRGRIPAGTNIHQPIYLRRWPNFTRLIITPYAMPIASLWAEQPRSLLDTASALNIPQRYVFAFYSAASAVQLAGETRRAVDTLIAPPAVRRSKLRGLFGSLLDRLRGGKKDHE